VVLDSRLELPLGSRLAATAREFPTLVVATAAGSAAREAALAAKGVETARVEPDPAGGVDLGATLRLLGQRGVTRVFSEGGPRAASRLIALGLADEAALFSAVKPLGRPGRPALDAAAYAALADRTRYRPLAPETYGTDALRRWERVG
jgi:diaminohydroxyphosphoribosylaminopyrimidine deaminase/5-amino-6-(5-phosphoribosylamino)uracil reductase